MNKEELIKREEEIKEVINNMPQNNKKNIEKYANYLKEQLDSFSHEKEQVLDEIRSRVDKILAKEKKKGIDFDKKDEEIENIACSMRVFNKWNSPYEKIDLDRIVYEINHYYKDNLDALNEDIRDAIKCFDQVGVKLGINDFCYSSYVTEYMRVILNSDDKGIKKKLDEVYWKSPKVMNQIASNFRYLYYKNEKAFVRYYSLLEKDILSKQSYKELSDKYIELIHEKDSLNYQIDNIISNIMNDSINVKDYSEDKLSGYEESISHGHVDIENYEALYYSLYEYKVYKEFSFIIDRVKELYSNKAQYKGVYQKIRKEISKLEGKLFKANKKIQFQKKFFKNKDKIDLLEIEVNETSDSLMEKYQELSDGYVHDKIFNFNQHTSYYDILKLVSSHYLYFRKLIEENQEDISDEEILDKRKYLSDFLLNNNLHFLPNIMIMDEANIPQIIGDKYKLLNINISADEIDNNTDNYMDIIKKILIINAITNSDISYEEILFQWNTRSILDDKGNDEE